MQVKALVRAHDVEDVLDPSYVPQGTEQKGLFNQKQYFMYLVFINCILTRHGLATVKRYSVTSDAQSVYRDLKTHYTSSTRSKLRSDYHQNFIMTAKLDETWKKTATAFLYTWSEQLWLYEEVTPINEHFPDSSKGDC